MRIKQLPPQIFNQIAAGEVIERPASVVKELLENALDAHATAISIEVSFGGLNLIKISDDGQGIDAEDLPLAIAAHATSKITHLNDLYHIATMGFRGEALASVASVSRMKIYSKPAYQSHGAVLKIDEEGIRTDVCPRNIGTTIEVRDLFYNAPVRKTFLKSERLEFQAIETVVKQFALAAPAISISLYHNQKLVLQLPKTQCAPSRLRRIKKLFGQTFVNDAVFIHEEHLHFDIQGWVSTPTYQRSQRDKQWIYLNHRLVKDKLLFQAIGQAYQDSLHPGRYPACILYLTLPSDQVDVNVHPTKHEVRFRDPRMIHALVVAAIAKSIHPASASTPIIPIAARSKTSVKKTPDPKPEPSFMAHHASYLILNTQFALFHSGRSSPYLLDMIALHRRYITLLLAESTYPLPKRALLVPVRIALNETEAVRLEQQRALLTYLGIEFDFIGAEQFLVRTLPLALPLLDLESFFAAIKKATYDQATLIQQLIAHQTFDAYNMTPLERDTLIDFCMQNSESILHSPFCTPLDEAHCQHLMRSKKSLSRVVTE